MIDLLNQLQPQINVEGQANASQDVNELMSAEGQLKAQEFKSLLKSAKGSEKGSDEELLNTLSKNYESAKELLTGDNKPALKVSVDNILKNAEVSPEEKVEEFKTLTEGERKSFFPKTKVNASLKNENTDVQTLRELRQNMVKSGGLNVGVAAETPEVAEAKTTQNLLLGGFDNSLKNASKNNAANTQAASMHFSEDFVSHKIKQSGNKKPLVQTSSKVMNIFEKEQETLGNDGILNKKKLSNVFKNELNTNNFKDEKVSAVTENIENFSETNTENLKGLNTPKTTGVNITTSSAAASKVIDLSGVQNPDQILKEISNYIETSRIQNGKELELTVNHNELGQFKVHAQKGSGNTVELQIIAGSDEAHNFFNKNEVNLLKTLSTQGVKVSDFKLTQSEGAFSANTGGKGNDSSGQNFSGNEQGFGRQFNGGDNSHNQGRQRRQELWDQYRERMGA